jgi:hypothetical protein
MTPDRQPADRQSADRRPADGRPAEHRAAGTRLRLGTIVGILLLHTLTLAVWAGNWVAGSVEGAPLAVGGDLAAPAVPALALCGLALGAALGIAGAVFRGILGLLQALLGVSIALSGVVVLTNPVAAAAPAVTARTGVSGTEGVADLLSSATATPLPAVAVVLGAASAALGVLLLLTGRRWPDRSRRFTAVRAEPAESATGLPADPIEEWDALSGGSDPTLGPGDLPDGLDRDRGTAG